MCIATGVRSVVSVPTLSGHGRHGKAQQNLVFANIAVI